MLHMNNAKAATILICIIFFRRPGDKMMLQLHGFFSLKKKDLKGREWTQLPVPTFCACGWHIDIKKHHQKLTSLYLKTAIYTKQAIYNLGQYFLEQIRK